jgi:hypothetical protein
VRGRCVVPRSSPARTTQTRDRRPWKAVVHV